MAKAERSSSSEQNKNPLESAAFDAAEHGKKARGAYERLSASYKHLAEEIAAIVTMAAAANGSKAQVTPRVKDAESFERKASEVDDLDPRKPKYPNPLHDITDMAGVRVITYVLEDVPRYEQIVQQEFEVLERVDKAKDLIVQKRFGYQSLHLIVKLKPPRSELHEYKHLADLVCEVQLRTVLQHGWAEIEHDIGYRPEGDVPPEVERSFQSLAGMLEIADREFQRITTGERERRYEIRRRIEEAEANRVAITGENMKILLDRLVGTDQRVSDWSYEWVARLAKTMGMKTISDAEGAIQAFDWKAGDAVLWITKPSPPTVFDAMLLEHFGRKYIEEHPWGKDQWFRDYTANKLRELEEFWTKNGRKRPR